MFLSLPTYISLLSPPDLRKLLIVFQKSIGASKKIVSCKVSMWCVAYYATVKQIPRRSHTLLDTPCANDTSSNSWSYIATVKEEQQLRPV